MGSLWRSKEMSLIHLYVQNDAARQVVDSLGHLGQLQFIDANEDMQSFQRAYVSQVRRCDEMERRLRFFEQQIEAADIHRLTEAEVQARQLLERTASATSLSSGEAALLGGGVDFNSLPRSAFDSMDELESTFADLEGELKQHASHQESLNREYYEGVELKHVLEKNCMFHDAGLSATGLGRLRQAGPPEAAGLLDDQPSSGPVQAGTGARSGDADPESLYPSSMQLGSITGMISRAQSLAFERVLFRMTRGNVFVRMAEIARLLKDPRTDQIGERNVFIVFFQGERLRARIHKVCESFGANIYACPETQTERIEVLRSVSQRLEELDGVLGKTLAHRRRLLSQINSELPRWTHIVRRDKAIYHTLNMFDYSVTRQCLLATAWCPSDATHAVQQALRRADAESGNDVDTILSVVSDPPASVGVPPTHFETNSLTAATQAIVDAYGVPRYREVNPAPFTIITFPFLFGVMFGDLGHGTILFLASLYLVVKERELNARAASLNEILRGCFRGRYTLLLMGLFSIYCGAMYNELFSLPTDLFGSAWTWSDDGVAANPNPGQVYPLGVDPVWAEASNSLDYLNSLKMKSSIILGFTHMMLGMLLGAMNMYYERRTREIFLEWIPMVLFMCSIIGYLVFLVFFKWFTGPERIGVAQDWDLINVLIVMLLNQDIPWTNPKQIMYPNQKLVQQLLVVVALISVPWMLFAKPLVLQAEAKAKARQAEYQPVPQVYNGNSAYAAVPTADDTDDTTAAAADEGKPADAPSAPPLTRDSSPVAPSKSVSAVPQSADAAAAVAAAEAKKKRFEADGNEHEGEEAFSMSELMIHQSIHCIEYILAVISHTASYLRLWALSLAHSELSQVLWEKIFLGGLNGSFIAMFLAFAIWAGSTIAVLLIMETLSAFLHALRLHWVEFQSKFLHGDGVPFAPFSYKRLLAVDAAAQQ